MEALKSVLVIAEGKTREEIEAEDQEEEAEAKNIQKRLAANLTEEDYDLNLFQVLLKIHVLVSHDEFGDR